jgi:hypothetical protein
MPSIKRAASAPGGSAGCNLDEVPPAHADGARAKPFFAGSRFMTWRSLKSKLLSSSEVAWLGATHWQVARVASGTAAIGRQHGRNDMFENNLHAGARLQHDRKAIIGRDLTAEPDAIHEEHVKAVCSFTSVSRNSSCTQVWAIMFLGQSCCSFNCRADTRSR